MVSLLMSLKSIDNYEPIRIVDSILNKASSGEEDYGFPFHQVGMGNTVKVNLEQSHYLSGENF